MICTTNWTSVTRLMSQCSNSTRPLIPYRIGGYCRKSGTVASTKISINGLVSSYVTGQQCVMVEGVRSCEDSVHSGVPQGMVLRPLLFQIHVYISDLPSVLDPDTMVRLFADHCLVYPSVRGAEDQRKLQQDLDALSLWGDCWGCHRFNASKCNIINMGNAKSQFFYQLNNQIFQSVSSAMYLGVTLSPSHMTWAGPSTLPLSSVRPTSSWYYPV